MRSKQANEFLERNRICDEVLITEAVAAVNFTEEELLTIENFRKLIDKMSDEHHAFISDLYKKIQDEEV